MVQDAKATITIRVVGGQPEPVPWWLFAVAGGLGIGTVAVVRSGTKKKKRKRR